MMIFNTLYLIYFLKFKNQMKKDYRNQYDKMAKKKKKSFSVKALQIFMKLSYLLFNAVLFSMLIFRCMSLTIRNADVNH